MREETRLANSEVKYANVTQTGDEIADYDHSGNPSMPQTISVDRRKFSPRGEVTHLLWLYVFMACMAVLFMCYSVLADACGTHITRQMRSTRSKETFDHIDTLRFFLVIQYTFIFASHSSMLMKRWTFFRFIDDRVRPDDDWNAKSPPVVKRSFGSILMSYVAINVYLLLVQLGLLLLQLQLDRTNSPIAPILEHWIFSSTLRYAAFFLYTYHIFDVRTNFAILISLADHSIFAAFFAQHYMCLIVLMTMQYRALCPHPVEPVRTVTQTSSESAQATVASTSPSHTSLLGPSVPGGNGSTVPGRSTDRDDESILRKPKAITECVLLGGVCIVLYIALSVCSGVLSTELTEGETQEVLERITRLFLIPAFMMAWAHILMICSCKSVITQENTVIRFINDNTGESEETRAVDTNADTSRSTIPVWLSLIAMWLYTVTLGLVLSALFVYAKFTGRVPDVISKPTFLLFFIAGTFCYTYRVFDVRTNLMFATGGAFCIMSAVLNQGFLSNATIVLMMITLTESYNYHCCTPLEPCRAIYGSYAPPVFTSQTGTASDVEVGEVQEAPICARPAVTLSNPTHDARGAYTILKDSGGVEDAEGSRA